MNFYDNANVVTRLTRGESVGWIRRRRQLIRLLNDLTGPPDRIRAEKMKKRVLQPVLRQCEQRAGRNAFPSALQAHAQAASQSLDRIAYLNSDPSAREFEDLRTHLHSCVTMIDAMLKSKEPAAMDDLFQKIIGGPSNSTATPFSQHR